MGQYQIQDRWSKDTGNEAFVSIDAGRKEVKKTAVEFENHNPLGRLFDIDVMGNGDFSSISRTELGLPVRKCLLCSRKAKDCSRPRRHTVLELQQAISQLYVNNCAGK